MGTRRERKSKDDAQNSKEKMQSRVMGFHVVCGLFEGMVNDIIINKLQ